MRSQRPTQTRGQINCYSINIAHLPIEWYLFLFFFSTRYIGYIYRVREGIHKLCTMKKILVGFSICNRRRSLAGHTIFYIMFFLLCYGDTYIYISHLYFDILLLHYLWSNYENILHTNFSIEIHIEINYIRHCRFTSKNKQI